MFNTSFLSLYSFNTSFTKTNLLWRISESIIALEITISMVFHLVFANNNILSCFYLFFLIIDVYLLVPAVVTKILNPNSILIGLPTKEAEAKIETQPVTAETKMFDVT